MFNSKNELKIAYSKSELKHLNENFEKSKKTGEKWQYFRILMKIRERILSCFALFYHSKIWWEINYLFNALNILSWSSFFCHFPRKKPLLLIKYLSLQCWIENSVRNSLVKLDRFRWKALKLNWNEVDKLWIKYDIL